MTITIPVVHYVSYNNTAHWNNSVYVGISLHKWIQFLELSILAQYLWAFISGVLNFGKFPTPQCWVASKPTFLCLCGKGFKLLITLTMKKAQVIVFHHLMNLCSFSKTPAYGSNIIYNCYTPQKILKRAFWYINVPPCIWQYYSIILISVSYHKSLFFSLGL